MPEGNLYGSNTQIMIACREVAKLYPGVDHFSVDHVTFEIASGALVVLLGPSGCGKTTLLKMINRLIEPTSGQIYVKDQEIHTLPATDLRRQIGYVIQQVGLFPHMTVRENISVVPRLLGWDTGRIEARVAFLMEVVGLPMAYLDRRPRQLSGGEQQRVGLARALAADPPILLMDEPFAAVDAITRLRLQDELRNIHRQLKKSILFVTHDVDEAFRLADRVLVMRAGKIVQYGAPLEIVRNPVDDFVRELTGAENLVRQLSLIPVQAVLDSPARAEANTPGSRRSSPAAPTVTLQDDLRMVLSCLLGSGAEAVTVLDGDSRPVAEIGFNDLRAALTVPTDGQSS